MGERNFADDTPLIYFCNICLSAFTEFVAVFFRFPG